SPEGGSSSSRPTSGTSSARSTTTGSCRWSPSACRTGGGSSCCGGGCVPGWLWRGGAPRRGPGGPPAGGSPPPPPTPPPPPSPLLANVYLAAFDRAWAESGTGELVRYADDFVVLCSSREEAEQAHARAAVLLGDLGLALHPDKTRAVDLRAGREGFDFLGCHL